jgi:hypothetical protein
MMQQKMGDQPTEAGIRLQLVHDFYITSVDGDVNSQAIYRQIKDRAKAEQRRAKAGTRDTRLGRGGRKHALCHMPYSLMGRHLGSDAPKMLQNYIFS